MSLNPILALHAYAGKYAKELMSKFYKELKLEAEGIKVIPGVKNKITMPRLAVGRGLKPYTGIFASMNNQLKYSDRELGVERVQRDLSIDPEKYRTTYLSENQTGSAGSNADKESQIPFAKFTFEKVMEENAEEVVDMLYWGVGKEAFLAFDAGTAYAAGDLVKFNATVNGTAETQYFKCIVDTNAGESPATHEAKWDWAGNLAIAKGYNVKIQEAITDEGFNQIADTGAINKDDAYDQFLEVFRILPERLRKKGVTMYCSANSKDDLLDAIENKVTKNYELIDGILYLPKTDQKCKIQTVEWLGGSDRLLCTMPGNFVLGTDQLSDMNKLTSIPKHYDLEYSLSFLIGLQIADLDVLAMNGQQ